MRSVLLSASTRSDETSPGSVRQKIPVSGEFRPRLHAAGNPLINSVCLREVAGSDPETFDRKADYQVIIPIGLALREDAVNLLQGGYQRVKRFAGAHNSSAPTAPGTSSVITWTSRPTTSEAIADNRAAAL